MRPQLLRLYGAITESSESTLSLPPPEKRIEDQEVLTLISTYLLHCISVIKETPSTPPDLLVWADARCFDELSKAHLDALYTRAYIIMKPHRQPFGLFLLLHSTSGVVQPAPFWTSATAVVRSYDQSAEAGSICDEILHRLQGRDWLKGSEYMKFKQLLSGFSQAVCHF